MTGIMTSKTPDNQSQIIIYQTESGQTKIEVRLENETVWLTQKLMAELFQTSKQNIGQHLRNIFAEGELEEGAVVKDFFTTAADGKKYKTKFYSLDAIISVGYRVQSHVATRFRQWATRLVFVGHRPLPAVTGSIRVQAYAGDHCLDRRMINKGRLPRSARNDNQFMGRAVASALGVFWAED